MSRIAWLLAGCIWCASSLDQAVLSQMGKARIVSRTQVSPDLDLVVAHAAPGSGEIANGDLWWGDKVRLGLFLQKREGPGVVYKIAMENGPRINEGTIRLERATATDVVFLWTPEKGRAGPILKFVYDIRAKALVKTVGYKPYSMARIIRSGGSTVAIGDDPERPLALELVADASSPFRILRGPEALRWMTRESTPVRFGPANQFLLSRPESGAPVIMRGNTRYELPQSTYDEFAAARPERVKNGYTRNSATINEHIGPSQLADGTVWFGRNFYDGEGQTGVGGFGYFDTAKLSHRLFSPAAVRDYSVSAILVEPEAVWLGLVNGGEWGSTGGGFARYDRATERTEHFKLREIVGGIARIGDRVLLATETGVAILDGNKVKRYQVDETTDGRLRVVELTLGKE